MPNKGQNFDSGGGDTRVRGNAYQVLEKYLQLARDAGTAGDRVAAENFLQHADHYYRVVAAMNEGQRPRIGGREVSVADVNVQNVSQGLSAALSGHGHSTGGEDHQGEPGEQQHRPGGNGQARPQQQQSQPQGGGNHGTGNHAGGNPESRNAEGGSDGQPAHASGNDSSETGGGDGSFAQVDEQPDYPEDLLPGDAQAAGASDGQGQGGGQGHGGQGQGDRQHGRMGRGRRRGPGRRIRNDGDDTPPPPSNPENA